MKYKFSLKIVDIFPEILLSFFLFWAFSNSQIKYLLLFSFIFILFRFKKFLTNTKIIPISIILIIVIFGFLVLYTKLYKETFVDNKSVQNLQKKTINVEIQENLQVKNKIIMFFSEFNGYKYQILILKGNKNINNMRYGKFIKLKNIKVQKIENKYNNRTSFNYSRYLLSKKIKYEITSYNYSEVKNKKKSNFIIFLRNIRLLLIKKMSKYKQVGIFVNSLLFGQNNFEKDTMNIFTISGLIQLFTISGLHINLISNFLKRSLRLLKIAVSKIDIIISLVLFCYLFIGGESAAIIRSVQTTIFITFFQYFFTENRIFQKLKTNKIIVLFLIFIFNFLLNPLNLLNIGFNLTYIFTAILYLNQEILQTKNNKDKSKQKEIIHYFTKYIKIKNIERIKNNFLYNKIKKKIKIFTREIYQSFHFNLIMNLYLFPIIIGLNSYTNFMYIFLIYFYEKIMVFMLYLSFLFFFLVVINFQKISLITYLIKLFYWIFDKLIVILFNVIYVSKFGIIYVTLPLLIIIYYYYLVLKIIKYEYFKIRKYNLYILLVMILLVSMFNISFTGEVNIIDIGQGDSILIRYPFNQKIILIDTGDHTSEQEEITYLQKRGIKTIDYLIFTHHHEDHMGNENAILENIDVKNIVIGKYYKIQNNEQIRKKNQKFKILRLKKSTYLFNNFYIYQPEEKDRDNENNNSLIVKTTLGNKSWLFMGDTEVEEEKIFLQKIKKQKINYIKLGHHGSKTSTSQMFLSYFQPDKVFISAGKHNKYHHPSDITIRRLIRNKIQYKITLKDGEQTIKF